MKGQGKGDGGQGATWDAVRSICNNPKLDQCSLSLFFQSMMIA